jgi:hypothetical protein
MKPTGSPKFQENWLTSQTDQQKKDRKPNMLIWQMKMGITTGATDLRYRSTMKSFMPAFTAT